MVTIKRIATFIIVLCLICLNFILPLGNGFISVAAEGEIVDKYVLINTSPEYYESAESVYNIPSAEKEEYTPFNSSTNSFYDGWSFSPTQNVEDGTINSTYNCLNVGEIDLTNKSLFVWIYFSNIKLQDIYEIILHTTTGDLDILLYYEQLIEVLEKDEFGVEGYSWNMLEIPLKVNENRTITSITFKSSSSMYEPEAYVNSADLNIYNVYISDTETNYINAKIKQKYVDFGVKYPTNDVLSTKFLGDTITFPSLLNNALSYAFYGKENLLTNPHARWKIAVVYNGGEPDYSYNFGDTYTFTKEGTYMIYYDCVFESEHIDYVKRLSVTIENFYGLYFNTPSMENLIVGETYVFNFSLNPSLTVNGEASLEYNSKYVDAEIIDGNKIKVTMKKAGDTSIKIKINGTRSGNAEENEYTAKINLEIDEEPVDHFKTFAICAYVALGVVGVAIIVYLINSFVKARKINVK